MIDLAAAAATSGCAADGSTLRCTVASAGSCVDALPPARPLCLRRIMSKVCNLQALSAKLCTCGHVILYV